MKSISRAICDGMEDCAMIEIPNRGGCRHIAPYQRPFTRYVVKWYTKTPGLTFDAPCGNSTARFFDPNVTDPYAPEASYWSMKHFTRFVNGTTGSCRLLNPPPRDGLVAVFDLNGIDRDVVEFDRESNAGARFIVVQTSGMWDGKNARITLELLRTFAFPDCCDPPAAFSGGGIVFRRIESESTCDVVDAAMYSYVGTEPTTMSRFNESADVWRFDVHPVNDACDGLLAEPFVVDVIVPRALADVPHVSSQQERRELRVDGAVVVGVWVMLPTIVFVLLIRAFMKLYRNINHN